MFGKKKPSRNAMTFIDVSSQKALPFYLKKESYPLANELCFTE